MTTPSSLPVSEPGRMPANIARAIERLEIAAHVLGGNFVSMQDADEADRAACDARAALDAAILSKLSAALARAERAERALDVARSHSEPGSHPSDRTPSGSDLAGFDPSRMLAELAALAESFEASGKTLICPEQYPPGYVISWEEAHRYCARDLRTLVAKWRQP